MEKKFDFQPIEADIEQVRKLKAAKKKKPNTSIKPLKFEVHPDDSPIKAEIIRRINEKNLTYSDMYAYCTEKLCDGDASAGETLGYNTIYGLRKRHTMVDTTLSMLTDFLNLDIMFVEKENTTDEEDDN